MLCRKDLQHRRPGSGQRQVETTPVLAVLGRNGRNAAGLLSNVSPHGLTDSFRKLVRARSIVGLMAVQSAKHFFLRLPRLQGPHHVDIDRNYRLALHDRLWIGEYDFSNLVCKDSLSECDQRKAICKVATLFTSCISNLLK